MVDAACVAGEPAAGIEWKRMTREVVDHDVGGQTRRRSSGGRNAATARFGKR